MVQYQISAKSNPVKKTKRPNKKAVKIVHIIEFSFWSIISSFFSAYNSFYPHKGIKDTASPVYDKRLVAHSAVGPYPLCDVHHSGAIVTIKGRCKDVQREYPEASNTPLLVQMKGPHQAKSLYQCKQPLLLWDASQMLGAKMSHH